MRIARVFTILASLLLPLFASGQSASEDWRTIRTEHFRVHFPASYELWARDIASKLESIRELVNTEVGYAPAETTDVVIADPMSQANGSAWPFVGAPRMIFWASPPSPSGALGYESDWGELLAIHEWTHVAHLVRESRRPMARARWLLAPVALGPIAASPRWISEGYATVVEGKLTGQGRPYSDYRAAILRTWAQRGRLPSYEQLNSDRSNWMGMSMAYLVGSAYLEWLIEHHGEDSLRKLSARMTSREERTFDSAFEGVFGESPKRLYQRFTAEITYRAMQVEAANAGTERPGELWMDLSWTTGEPDVTRDGRRLVTIARGKEKPPRIVVYSTERDEKAESEYSHRLQKILERDPQDVAPVRSRPLPRKPIDELVFRPAETVGSPRWIGSSGDVLFVLFVPDAAGFLRPDLYRWTPGSGVAPIRLTRGEDLRDARPSADGKFAIAVRNRYGLSELVRIDLDSGRTTTIDGPSLDIQFADPEPHPTLSRVALVLRRKGKWQLVVRDMTGGTDEAVLEFDGIVAQPVWSRDGTSLFATVARDGAIEISRFDYEPASGALSERGQVTRGKGASLAPTVSDDALWFLALDPDGLDLRRMPITSIAEPLPAVTRPSGVEPTVRRVFAGPAATIVRGDVPQPTPYGIGRQEVSPIFGGAFCPSGGVIEGGVRIGDIVGRLETLALFSAGFDGGTEGGAVSIMSRRRPTAVGAHLFAYDESPSEQKDGTLSSASDLDRFGVEVSLSRDRHWRGGKFRGSVALYGSDIDASGADSVTELGAGLAAQIEHSRSIARGLLMPISLSFAANAGTTDSESWSRGRAAISVGASTRGQGATLMVAGGTAASDVPAAEQFEIGGTRGSLLPDAATANRVDVPALPAGILRGPSFDSVRLDVKLGPSLPSLFAQRVRADVASGDDEVSLAGLEWAVRVAAMPIVRIPACEFRLGAAHVVDSGLLEDETSFWMTMRWVR